MTRTRSALSQDTLTAGDGWNLPAVTALLEEAPSRIEELIGWGKEYDTKLEFGIESTSRKSRALHAHGESASREALRVLCRKAQASKNISIVPGAFASELLMESERVGGVSIIDEKGVLHAISCSAVMLATGGVGQLYRNTTNPESATADGIALARRAGAELADLEFIQFHPTALHMKKVPRFLLPESLRVEGAYLRNFELNRFMAKYHPEGERAPRNLVVRAIVHEMEVSRSKDPFVYLDLTHLNAGKVRKYFPRIYESFMAHNIDITEDVIPIRPAAHSSIGGVRADVDGRTSVAGLYAAGEAASNGLHGANRLPSNTLLEGLVYGTRAARTMREGAKAAGKATLTPFADPTSAIVDADPEGIIDQIQNLMWNEVGVVRIRTGMQKAVNSLEEMATKLAHPKTRRGREAANLHLAALLVARSALAREESRGAHYRIDYPDHDDKKFLKHSIVRGEKVLFLS